VDSQPVEDRADAILFAAGLLEIEAQVFNLFPGGLQVIGKTLLGPGRERLD